ncbi:hypothetical protein QTP88_018295 [Uroleucon formosanum]
MSDKKRIYLSGYAKRKLKKESEDAVSKLPKLTNFFETINSANGVETNKNNKNDLVLNNSYIHVENMNNDSNDSNSVMPNTIENSKSDIFNFSENNVDNFNSNVHTIELDIELYQDREMWPLNMNPKKFQSSEKKFKNFNCSLNISLFELKLPNGEIHLRKWLMFSEHTGNVYCFVCKLFNKSNNSSFINPGFNNWKKSHEKVKEHENSAIHRKSMLTWLDRVNTKNRIDKTMAGQMLREKKYWVEVLCRVLIENARRTSLHQEKLNSLVLLSAERDITNTLDFSDLIQKFNAFRFCGKRLLRLGTPNLLSLDPALVPT